MRSYACSEIKLILNLYTVYTVTTRVLMKRRKKRENENFQNSNAIAYSRFFETSRTFETHLQRNKI